MPYVADDVRAQAEAGLQALAQSKNWQVTSAGLAPLSGLPMEQGSFDADYALRVHYNDCGDAPDTSAFYERASVLPGTRILVMPVARAELASGGAFMQMADQVPAIVGVRLTEPYILALTSDMLASEPALEAIPVDAAGDQGLRRLMYQGAGWHVALAHQFATGDLDRIRADMIAAANADRDTGDEHAEEGEEEDEDFAFGAFGAIAHQPADRALHALPPATIEEARTRHLLARGFVGLAIQSQALNGLIPPHDQLEFSPGLQELLGYSLAQAMEQVDAGQAPDFIQACETARRMFQECEYAAFPYDPQDANAMWRAQAAADQTIARFNQGPTLPTPQP